MSLRTKQGLCLWNSFDAQHQHRIRFRNVSIRHHASTKSKSNQFKIHMIGGTEYDSLKQIRMVQLPSVLDPNPKTLAYTYVKRNIIFGTNITQRQPQDRIHDSTDTITVPILQRALEEASKEGDQPQGLASLYGLSRYVKYTFDHPEISPVMQSLIHDSKQNDQGSVIFHAIQAMAMQTPRIKGLGTNENAISQNSDKGDDPRPSQSGIGWGTYNDARIGWTKLAKEYALLPEDHDVFKTIRFDNSNMRIAEHQIFPKVGGVFINVEYIGYDENPEYWKDAGGSMARFFFL